MEYSDFTMHFPNRTLTIRGALSKALFEGLRVGFLVLISHLIRHNLALQDDNSYITYQITMGFGPRIIGEGMAGWAHPVDFDKTYQFQRTHRARDDIIQKYPNSYILVIRDDPGVPNEHLILVFDEELELREFLQGVITILHGFNINSREVLVAAPFRGGQDYTIQGITLPLLA